MAAFNFPNSPSTNDLHTENSVTWKWNGTVWKRVNNSYLTASTLDVSGIGTFAGNINANGNIVGDNSTNITGIAGVTASTLTGTLQTAAQTNVTSLGTLTGLTVSGDVSIVDKIVHSGDTNTAIRFPATDEITFETSGSERLRIASTGNMGLGDLSNVSYVPQVLLHIANTSPIFRIQDTTNDFYGHISADDGGNLSFDSDAGNGAGSSHMTFKTDGSEKLRIDSNGCVRVGNTATQTTSSNTKRIALGGKGSIQGWVSGQLNGCVQLLDNYYWDGSNNKAIEADHCAYLSLRSGTLRFGSTNSTQTAGQNVSGGINERLRITSDGKLGIGVNSPSTAMHLKASDAYFTMQASSSSGNAGILFKDSGGTQNSVILYDFDDDYLKITTNNDTERLRITSGGSVRIGGSTPVGYSANANVDDIVVGGTSSHGITILTGNSATGSLWFDSENGNRGYIQYPHNEEALILGTEGNERLRILSTGDVCIGRSSQIEDAKLSIQCDSTEAAIGIQCNQTNVNTDLITAFNSGGKNIINICAETDNSPNLRFEVLSGNTAVERFRINHYGNVAIGGGSALNNKLEIIADPEGFPSDSAQPHATLLIKHGTSGSNRRWVGIGASLTGAWIQSSSPGGSGLAAPLWINKGGGDVTLGNDRLIIKNSGSTYDTGSKTITGGTNLAIQNFRVKGIWSGSPSIGKEIELISGYDGSVKMAAIGYNLTNTNTGSTYGGDLVFHTQPLYGSPTTPIPESMRISSSGYVTQSKQPCFHVSLEGHKNATQDPLVFTDVRVNTGSHYSSSTGKFTAPVAGRYLFFFMGIKNSNNNTVTRVYVRKNNASIYDAFHCRMQEEGNYANGSIQWIMSLAVNDTVHLRLDNGGLHAAEYTQFGGYLIG